ncbi:MAG TPA: methyltransferase domain-containing protein, partial [candidate division Zixibacteria bacterium]|nr:methyltransferase domain-containing protein [candidate division Zixibacteria bacterium]
MGRPDHEQNRRFWDEIADIHYRHPDYRVAEFLAGRSTLRPIERRLLGEVGGRTLLHLFCQFGLDTLSWARLGADATGVDISGRSIALAGELRRQTGLRAEFVQADVLELIGRLDRTFDIVFQS